jgi:hypothetical protein
MKQTKYSVSILWKNCNILFSKWLTEERYISRWEIQTLWRNQKSAPNINSHKYNYLDNYLGWPSSQCFSSIHLDKIILIWRNDSTPERNFLEHIPIGLDISWYDGVSMKITHRAHVLFTLLCFTPRVITSSENQNVSQSK